MARIAIGGWQHETNTFATIKADYAAFERQDEWPPLCEGAALFVETKGVHLPITGAIETLSTAGHELLPLLWCSATPSAHVTEHAFETIATRLLDRLQAVLPVDGVYLDLHGAMVCEHFEDGEGELLRRVRQLVGEDVPVVASLDLHANVTPLMVAQATALDIFRTYPHVDMAETGSRAAALLDRLLESGERLYPALRQIEFMIALNAGCSLIEPCQSLYAKLPELIEGEVLSASFACGFHLADIHDAGPTVVTYGLSESAANKAADGFAALIYAERSSFSEKIWPAVEGVAEAIRLVTAGASTVVLADTQDNPGGGGSGDTTGLLQALIAGQAESVLFGALSDPLVAATAHEQGIGAEFDARLGGRSGLPGQAPWPVRCRVLALGDGNFTATGPMYLGARMALGLSALLDIDGVHVAVVSHAVQTADQSILRHLGAEPAHYAIVAVKSSVHFRNDFTGIADDILVVAAPGAVVCDPGELVYRNVRREMSIGV